jgi:hypothetical protein
MLPESWTIGHWLALGHRLSAIGPPPSSRPRWTVGGLVRLVAACGVALGMLRSPLGEVFALMAGGVVGCGLAPLFACRGMRTLDRALGERPESDPLARHRPRLLAQSYVLIWAAWFFAGVAVAAVGVLLSRMLRAGAGRIAP